MLYFPRLWLKGANMERRFDPLRLAGIGWYIATCILLGVVGGVWLDDRFQVRPLFTLLGLVLGLVVAFYGMYKMLLTATSRKPDK